ncbi:MAG: Fe-S cluster assembly protein SufD [Acidobacteria bacterium]|nr:MAG: Fe-S cluster assembly protein SufD [Acidobacteriota bacterium]REJ99551.1 MAG: Fe-S cluster assembly protein SufD [Acidobacteriota bacterium]
MSVPVDTQISDSPALGPLLEEMQTLGEQGSTGPLLSLRQHAGEAFRRLGFPTTRLEEWRFTDVSRVANTRFLPDPRPPELAAERLAPFLYAGCRNVVLLNGRVVSELSDLDISDAPGLTVRSLAEALEEPAVAERIGSLLPPDQHPFVALNTALFRDGVYLEVEAGARLEEPLHLVFLGETPDGQATVSYPRNLFVLGERSECTVIETYASLDDGESLTCPVTEVLAGASSVCKHFKVQKESLAANHLASFQVRLDRATNFSSHAITHGGALVRNDVGALLDGEGAVCTLNGLYVVAGEQQVDNHMRVEHKKPHTYSHELFKGILDGNAKTVFNGRIYVHREAQKTDAKQSNRNLLLSDQAIAHSNPQLEIFADDVRCTHGSTTGHLEEEAVFYLRSRGIDEAAATSLLTYAFASEFVDLVEVEALRRDLQNFLFSRLTGGDIVRQAV